MILTCHLEKGCNDFENKVQNIIVYRLQTCKLINYALQMNYDGTTREMTL